jgi:hypothetical protein
MASSSATITTATQITAAAAALAAALLAGCRSRPAAAGPPSRHAQRLHAVQVCDGLASAAAKETGDRIGAAEWLSEVDAAVLPTVGSDSPTGYVTNSMFLDIANVMAPGPPPTGSGLPSASTVRALQLACDAAGVTASVWPPGLTR